jgi:serine/threonine-protein kinase
MALEDARDDDPTTGWLAGSNEIVCRLSPRHFLALRGEAHFVVIERLDVEPASLTELRQHAMATANLSHPNLAKVYGCDTCDEGTFWVTELVPGATLSEIRAACKKAGKSLPYGLVFGVIHEAALALGELHGRRRAHGNVRDGNLLVGFSGTAKVLNPGVMDSIQRLPPDPVTDVFVLSNLLYECLTGQGHQGPAFAPPSSFNHALEKPIDDLLARALGSDRSRRFKTGAELAKALKAAAGAFIWKPAQRAEFVQGLFRNRQRRGELITHGASARLAALRAERAAAKAAAEEAAAHAEFIKQTTEITAVDINIEPSISPVVVGQLLEELPPPKPAEPPKPPREVYSVPKRAVLLSAAAIAGIVGCVTLVNLMTDHPDDAGGKVIAPPIPILVPVAVAAPAAPAPAPAPAAPVVTMASAAEDAAEPAQPETPHKVKRKKKSHASGDGPLPPWLMRKGRR